MPESGRDSVSSALGEILGIEQDRLAERRTADQRLAEEHSSRRAALERERELLRDAEQKSRRLRELEARLAETETGRDELAGLRTEVQRLRDENAELRRQLEPHPGPGTPRPPSHTPPPLVAPPPTGTPPTQRCINVGTPLEECWRCTDDRPC
jgi:hypothetical protein